MGSERRELQEQQRRAKALAQLSERACEVVLVRHGETQWNCDQRLQGQLLPGPGLTERGQQQAEVLAARLRGERFDAIYSSDLLRATQTAEAVAAARHDGHGGTGAAAAAAGRAAAGEAGSAVRLEPRLRERHLGALQGLTRAEGARLHPRAYEALCEEVAPFEGAPETVPALEARAAAVLSDLAARHPGHRILVVTHGGFLQAAHLCAAGHPNWGRNVNASINTLRVEALLPGGAERGQTADGPAAARTAADGQCTAAAAAAQPRRCLWAVVRWGDADHLEGVGALASAFGGGTEG